LITESDALKSPMSWTPDGKTIVYWVNGAQTNGDIWYVPIAGDKKSFHSLQTAANERHPQLSPTASGSPTSPTKPDVLKFISNRFLKDRGKWQISTERRYRSALAWRQQGTLFLFGANIVGVEIKVSGTSIVAASPKTLFAVTSNPGPTSSSIGLHVLCGVTGRQTIPDSTSRRDDTQRCGGGSLAEVMSTAADQGGTATSPPTR